MWTLFVFVGAAYRARPFDCVMVEGNDVPDTEARFKKEIKFSHLVFGYRTFSAPSKQGAWTRAVDQGVIPKERFRAVHARGRFRTVTEEHPTVSHPDHYLNKSHRAKVVPLAQITPANALRCTKCLNWFSWVTPTSEDGSYTCRECRGEVWAGGF
jgi:hypothetical protein